VLLKPGVYATMEQQRYKWLHEETRKQNMLVERTSSSSLTLLMSEFNIALKKNSSSGK
jgi:hypothetical protein